MSRLSILSLTLLLVLGGAFIYTSLSPLWSVRDSADSEDSEDEDPNLPPGHWEPLPEEASANPEQVAIQRKIEQLASISYVQGAEPPPESMNVTRHVAEKAQPGLNLIVSGHGPEAVLMNMEGERLHRWAYDFEDVGEATPVMGGNRWCWRRAHAYPNGDLLAIYEGVALVRLDRHSNLIWSLLPPKRAHHDLDIADDGTIYVLTRTPHLDPELNRQEPVLEDFVTRLTPDGEPIEHISILRTLLDSPYAHYVNKTSVAGDPLHTNTLQVLDGRFAHLSPAFEAGNLLLSMRSIHLLAILDPKKEEIVWAMAGPWRSQHEPVFNSNGNLLLFDNRGIPFRSSIYEIDPLTGECHWLYRQEERMEFFSRECGVVRPLPNDNVLVVESLPGRAFELTREKEIVWEFFNPYRAGDNDEYIAVLYDCVRLPDDYFPWLDVDGIPQAAAAGSSQP